MSRAKMNPEAKVKWLKALRSGEYEQTTEILQNKHGFCCLGVLCKVAEKDGLHVEHNEDNALSGDTLTDQMEVNLWAQIPTPERAMLMKLNDENGHSFEEIADYIERNL